MSRLNVMAVLVCVCILAGCGSVSENKEVPGEQTATKVTVTNDSGSSTNDGENKEGQTNESSTKNTETAAEAEVKEAEAAKAAKEVDKANEVKETAKTEEKEEPKESKKNQEVKKAIAANKAANSAVGGSIMNKNETDAPAVKNTDKAEIEKAVKEIRSLAKDLKQKAEDGDTQEVKVFAGQINKAWDAVKPDIKASVADMYTFLDEKITLLAEQTDAEEIDLEAVIQIDYQIYQGFRQLAEKLGIE